MANVVIKTSCAFSALTLLVGRHTCIWPSWCHCHSLSLASVKSRLVLPFWYRLTWVVPDKGPLNGCVCVIIKTKCTLFSMQLNTKEKWDSATKPKYGQQSQTQKANWIHSDDQLWWRYKHIITKRKNKSILYCSSISNLQVSVANVQYLVTRTLA